MLQPVYLLFERFIQLAPTVTMDIGPHRGHPVQVTVAIRVDQPAALSPGDNDRLVPFPILHLGKGMPDVTFIPFLQLFGRNAAHSPSSRSTISVSGCPSSQSARPSTASCSSMSSRCGQMPSTGAPHNEPM